jgi:hypothetical protein
MEKNQTNRPEAKTFDIYLYSKKNNPGVKKNKK